MNYDTLLMYAFVSFFYIISPGPAVFLAIYNGAMRGMKVALFSAFGNIIGLLVLSTISISGLSAILLASSTLFTLVKVLGASYLIYLGLKQLVASKKGSQFKEANQGEHTDLFSSFREGFFIAVTNPKPILFFAALFPQFLDVSQQIAPQFTVMTGIFMLFSFCSLSFYALLAKQTRGLLTKPNNSKWFQRVSGGLFIGLGASLFQLKSTS